MSKIEQRLIGMTVVRDTLLLDIHGVRARVVSSDWETLAKVAEDFSQCHADPRSSGDAAIEVLLVRERPRYDRLPRLRAKVHTPRNICFTDGTLTFIDYFGKALAIYSRESQRVEVHCERPHLLHEIAYLTLVSRIAEHLER